LIVYGRLYNQFAVDDPRFLCPQGWHVSSDHDWIILETFLNMDSIEVLTVGMRGTDQGTRIKNSGFDLPPWSGTNVTGFSAVPSGNRNAYYDFYAQLNDRANFWTSTNGGIINWVRQLTSEDQGISRMNNGLDKRHGLSVRCVRDEGIGCLDPDNDGVCAENEVSGCTDSDATNFNPSATEDDGSCVISGPAQCGGASTVTFDGHAYNLVGIGNQCWFKENLRSDNYRNGDSIPGDLTNSQWTSTGSGAQAVYNNDPANLATYGRLYNWYAVNDTRGLCPEGFHVPSDSEWTILENALGGSSVAGTALKSSAFDSPAWDGSNSSSFLALPCGHRSYPYGTFMDLGLYGFWWGSSLTDSYAWLRNLISGYTSVNRYDDDARNGFSVRCIKD
jgi:uncharacterized protein (TIGR02145 family)